jgi:cation:H+ antiporter
MWITALLQLLVGTPVLMLGAEGLVRGAARLAQAIGISPLVVGLTVVAFGTSAPELAVTAMAVFRGEADLGLGNIVGSNVVNILVVLGLAAAIAPIRVSQQTLWPNLPVMIAVSLVLYLMALDGTISRADGALLLLGAVSYTTLAIVLSRRAVKQAAANSSDPPPKSLTLAELALAWLWVILGLVGLVWGAYWMVEGAKKIAEFLGISQLVIGLTVVALGTSLPELATSCWAAVRGQRDIALGNAIGSNIGNILGILGLTAALAPHGVSVHQEALRFDIPLMLAVAAATFPLCAIGRNISRWEGVLLLAYYVLYVGATYARAVGQLTEGKAFVYLVIVAPLVVITLSALVHRFVSVQNRQG